MLISNADPGSPFIHPNSETPAQASQQLYNHCSLVLIQGKDGAINQVREQKTKNRMVLLVNAHFLKK